jgi:periplasmic protein TonB
MSVGSNAEAFIRLHRTATKWPIRLTNGNMRRGSTLLLIVVVHGLIISALLTHPIAVRSVVTLQPILVTMIDKPPRPPVDWKLPTLKLNPSKTILLPKSTPHVAIYAEPSPRLRGLDSEQPASNANGIGSKASGAGANVEGRGQNISVLHQVQPIYPPASVWAREQGYVLAQVLVDEQGHAAKVEVVRSSGYDRLDQSAVVAIRQWTFTPTKGSVGPDAWTAVGWEFELSPPNLSSVPVFVLPFDAAMARRLHLAATAMIGTDIPTPPGAGALDQLIEKLQTYELSVEVPPGPIPPIRLLATWGAVSSIHFMGNWSHGLEIEFDRGIDPHNKEEIHWEHYEVTQPGGVSEWLIAVSQDGAIRHAQAMICAPAQNAASGCL